MCRSSITSETKAKLIDNTASRLSTKPETIMFWIILISISISGLRKSDSANSEEGQQRTRRYGESFWRSQRPRENDLDRGHDGADVGRLLRPQLEADVLDADAITHCSLKHSLQGWTSGSGKGRFFHQDQHQGCDPSPSLSEKLIGHRTWYRMKQIFGRQTWVFLHIWRHTMVTVKSHF